jgi:hypothetical protein
MKTGTFVYLVAGLMENREGRLTGRERIKQEAIIRDDEMAENKGAEQECRTRYRTRVQRLVQDEANHLGTNTFDSLVTTCLVLGGHISEIQEVKLTTKHT